MLHMRVWDTRIPILMVTLTRIITHTDILCRIRTRTDTTITQLLQTPGWTKLVGAERLRPGGALQLREKKNFTQAHPRLTSISKVTIPPAITKGGTGHRRTGLCENTEVHTRDTLALVRFLLARVLPTSWKTATTVKTNTSPHRQFQRTGKRC